MTSSGAKLIGPWAAQGERLMPGFRLPRGGTRIDRTRPLRFTFDGASVGGFAGDTVASALIASGRTLVARSFKYHRAARHLFRRHRKSRTRS